MPDLSFTNVSYHRSWNRFFSLISPDNMECVTTLQFSGTPYNNTPPWETPSHTLQQVLWVCVYLYLGRCSCANVCRCPHEDIKMRETLQSEDLWILSVVRFYFYNGVYVKFSNHCNYLEVDIKILSYTHNLCTLNCTPVANQSDCKDKGLCNSVSQSTVASSRICVHGWEEI